jgi:hypothetical protein
MENKYPSKLDKFIPDMPLDKWYLLDSEDKVNTVKEWIDGDYLRVYYLTLSKDCSKFKKTNLFN